MIGCDACGTHFHAECIGFSAGEASAITVLQRARQKARVLLQKGRVIALQLLRAGHLAKARAALHESLEAARQVLLTAPEAVFVPATGASIPDPRTVEEPTEAELAIEAATMASYSGRGRPKSLKAGMLGHGDTVAETHAMTPLLDPVVVSAHTLMRTRSRDETDVGATSVSNTRKSKASSGYGQGTASVRMEQDDAADAAVTASEATHAGASNGVSLFPPPLQPSAPYAYLRLGGAALLPYSHYSYSYAASHTVDGVPDRQAAAAGTHTNA